MTEYQSTITIPEKRATSGSPTAHVELVAWSPSTDGNVATCTYFFNEGAESEIATLAVTETGQLIWIGMATESPGHKSGGICPARLSRQDLYCPRCDVEFAWRLWRAKVELRRREKRLGHLMQLLVDAEKDYEGLRCQIRDVFGYDLQRDNVSSFLYLVPDHGELQENPRHTALSTTDRASDEPIHMPRDGSDHGFSTDSDDHDFEGDLLLNDAGSDTSYYGDDEDTGPSSCKSDGHVPSPVDWGLEEETLCSEDEDDDVGVICEAIETGHSTTPVSGTFSPPDGAPEWDTKSDRASFIPSADSDYDGGSERSECHSPWSCLSTITNNHPDEDPVHETSLGSPLVPISMANSSSTDSEIFSIESYPSARQMLLDAEILSLDLGEPLLPPSSSSSQASTPSGDGGNGEMLSGSWSLVSASCF